MVDLFQNHGILCLQKTPKCKVQPPQKRPVEVSFSAVPPQSVLGGGHFEGPEAKKQDNKSWPTFSENSPEKLLKSSDLNLHWAFYHVISEGYLMYAHNSYRIYTWFIQNFYRIHTEFLHNSYTIPAKFIHNSYITPI